MRMERIDLQWLGKLELTDLVLSLQRPAKTSSKLPSGGKKEERENSRFGGQAGV